MKLKILLLATLLLLLPRASFSQTPHICDTPAPPTATAAAGSATLAWCSSGKDADGQALTILSQALYVDSVRFSITGKVAPEGSSPVSGLTLYTFGVLLKAGQHSYEVADVNDKGKEGSKSLPFGITVTPPAPGPPTAPVRVTIRQP